MEKAVADVEKKIVEEVKKLEPIVEAAFAEVVSGKTFSCWGWSVHIGRCPSVPTPPKQVETPDNKSETPSAPASV
jgi:hypothetical protein